MDTNYTTILKSTDYSRFSLLSSNRNINESKVKAIIKSMEEKYLVNPIMVNEKFQIIDGQHRFEASKRLLKPIYYFIIAGYSDIETSLLNTNSSNWGVKDFIKSRVITGGESYKVYEMIQNSSKLNPTDLIGILSGYYGRDSKATSNFKKGIFVIYPREETFAFLNLLIEVTYYFPRAVDYRFIKALGKAVQLDNFSSEHFMYKLSSFNLEISERNKGSEYLEEIENIYNYRTRNAKKIRLT